MISTALITTVDADVEITGSELGPRVLAVVTNGLFDLLALATSARAETPKSWAA